MSAVLECPHCGTQMTDAARFCPGCKTPRTAVREELEKEAADTGISYETILARELDREQDSINQTIRVRDHDDSQNSIQVQTILGVVAEILTDDEEVIYAAVQDPKAPSVRKAGVIATDRRLIFYQPQMVGSFNFDDHQWMDIADVHLKQGMVFSGLAVRRMDGSEVRIDHLNKGQARKLYSIAQKFEHEWREYRRQRKMEEERARAGGVIVQTPTPSAPSSSVISSPSEGSQSDSGASDPMARLQKAKAMRDNDLITEEEYEQTKARILAEL